MAPARARAGAPAGTGQRRGDLASILDEALGASIATRVCRSELWSLSDTWPGWQGFLADWTAAQPVGNATARRAALARWRALPRFGRSLEPARRDGDPAQPDRLVLAADQPGMQNLRRQVLADQRHQPGLLVGIHGPEPYRAAHRAHMYVRLRRVTPVRLRGAQIRVDGVDRNGVVAS